MKTFHGYRYAASYNGPSYSGAMNSHVELFRSVDAAREAFRSRVNGSGAWPQTVTNVEMEDGAFIGKPVTESVVFPATTNDDYMDLHPLVWLGREECWTYCEDSAIRFVVGARKETVRTERF
ncbi:hypothetical protein AB0F96_04075 [Streptomyces sp. NPDC023998]|uniref:hypothetical protein n=1 Tax=Streptomyces sp. NPDC023998 TaxID=3154597 RepID=UPI0033FEEBFF